MSMLRRRDPFDEGREKYRIWYRVDKIKESDRAGTPADCRTIDCCYHDLLSIDQEIVRFPFAFVSRGDAGVYAR